MPVAQQVPSPPVARARRTYLGLRRALVAVPVLTALFWLVTSALVLEAHRAALDVRDRLAPAYLGTRTAHAALSDAGRSAWESFRTGEARLIGPGQRYRDDITTAGENLERLAQLDTTGEHGREELKAVSGQLVTYQGLVEQADATYRAGETTLSTAYLTYASTLLTARGGLLERIDDLGALNAAALSRHERSTWAGPAWAAAPATLAAALLAVLVTVQVTTARRFKRTVNPGLLLSAAALAGLTAWSALALADADARLHDALRSRLPAASAVWREQIRTAEAGTALLRAGKAAPATGGLDVEAAAPALKTLQRVETAAAGTHGLTAGLPLMSGLVAALGCAGIGVRLYEFRG